MGTMVTYEENEPPADQPTFDFTNWSFPKADTTNKPHLANVLERVPRVNASEARHLWWSAQKHGDRFRFAIDAGAGIGTMTYALALLYQKVWAYEPWPENHHLLEINSVFLPPCDVTLHPYALSNLAGRALMFSSNKSRRDAHLRHAPKGEKGDEHWVLCRMLDEHIEPDQPVDMIKLDVEGIELEVLEGGRKTIERWKPLIYLELKTSDFEAGQKYMADIGYELKESHTHNYLFAEK